MRYFRCAWTAFRFECIGFTRGREQHFTLIQAIPTAILFAYIASVSDRVIAQSYIYFGVLYLIAWANTIFRVGWGLSGEMYNGTLDLSMVSRAPTSALVLGRASAIAVLGLAAGAIGVGVVALFNGEPPPAEHAGLLLLGLGLGALALLSLSMLMAPINLIVDARAGFFNGIIPALFFFSGYIFPPARLPDSLEVFARILPSSWAMEAVVGASQGASTSAILEDCAIAVALTAVVFVAAKALIDVVEHRIRVTGELGRS
jgi:ABC-type multidrug transport system permease subunit